MRDYNLSISRGAEALDRSMANVPSLPTNYRQPLPLVVIDIHDFIAKELPARETILGPWLLSQSLNMIYSWRGVGKTHVALGIAYAVASGGKFLTWEASRPHTVLYIDGEMPAPALQERVANIALTSELQPERGMLRVGGQRSAGMGDRYRRVIGGWVRRFWINTAHSTRSLRHG